MRAALMAILLIASATFADAQARDASDRAIGTDTSRERAETKLDRLRRDRREKEEAASTRTTRERPAPRENTARPPAER